MISGKGKTETYGEKIEDKEEATMRNVAGEIHGQLSAMKNCLERGESVMELNMTMLALKNGKGEWKANKKGTKAPKAYYRENRLTVHFYKAPSHTGQKYNEMGRSASSAHYWPTHTTGDVTQKQPSYLLSMMVALH